MIECPPTAAVWQSAFAIGVVLGGLFVGVWAAIAYAARWATTKPTPACEEPIEKL